MFSDHSNGVSVLYVNGEVEYVHMNAMGLEGLRWDEENTQFKFSDYSAIAKRKVEKEPHIKSVIALIAVIGIVGLAIVVVTRVWKYWLFALPMAVGASMIGLPLGYLGEMLYQSSYMQGIGAGGSGVLGYVAGLCYVGILMKFQERLVNKESVGQFAVAVGMAFGVFCSTLLHLGLQLIYQDSQSWKFMVMGLPFGIIGGGILGLISGRVVWRFYREEVSVVVENGE